MRIARYFFLALLLAAVSACSAPAQASTAGGTTPTPAAPLTTVHWDNFTYTATCYGRTLQFHTQKGFAQSDGVSFQIYKPVFGDIAGNGDLEAALPYSCAAADFGGVRVFVFTGNADHPSLLGENLPLPISVSGWNVWGSVERIHIANKLLTLTGKGYTRDAPHCCPDLQIEASYRWDGKHFNVVTSQVLPLKTTA
jgi:hypothetical protein